MTSFPLAGNEPVKASVESAAKHGRLPHAVIIEGEYGIGKHTLSRYLTSLAVCTAEKKPCGECRSCHLADVGTHPDIIFVNPESGKKYITVDRIRTLRADVYIKPHFSETRVFVIDPADSMNEQAQNALLKVLEEPPGSTLYILITANKSALLETVISRCAVFTLSSPTEDEAMHVLTEKGYEANAAMRALSQTGNNIGRAEAMLGDGKQSNAQAAASEFLNSLFDKKEYALLKILTPFEKDRIAAGEFYAELKYNAAKAAKSAAGQRRKALLMLYDSISKPESLLTTNVNLPLVFSYSVCEFREILRQCGY